MVDDKGISRVILDLKVKCKYYTDGCPWTGELRDLEVFNILIIMFRYSRSGYYVDSRMENTGFRLAD